MSMFTLPQGVAITGTIESGFEKILTPEAIEFIVLLQRTFNTRRKELLAKRAERQKDFDAGKMPDFLPETASVRSGDWKVAPIAADLQNRRIEITGPVERKMIMKK